MVDVILFGGQSNMGGRGTANEKWPEKAPEILPGAGFEFRAVSAAGPLFGIEEPFGAYENRPGGIWEPGRKTGSMVTAFVNAYYRHNGGVPVVAISASKGGSSIALWQPGGAFLEDALRRLRDCLSCLAEKTGCRVRHVFLAWCQGETDADEHMPPETYETMFGRMKRAFLDSGAEKVLLVRIGRFNGEESGLYDDMIRLQTRIAQTDPDVVMVSCLFAAMRERGLMKDRFHYFQAAYNLVGTDAGMHAAAFVQTGIEPSMEDPFFGNIYEPLKRSK
jgi:hypothetical protein